MRFLIYGAGALGQAMGCMLSASGHDVSFVLRKRFARVISLNGLTVQGIFGSFSSPFSHEQLFETAETANQSYDYILLTTKTYDTQKAISEILSANMDFNSIVSMQNGCGNVERLEYAFGKDKVMGARVITGFEIKSPGLVNITVSADDIHVGSSQRGAATEKETLLAAAISKAGHPCIVVNDIYQSLFSKLLYNCTLNPLGAVLGVHYGLLAEQPETVGIMNAIIEETFDVITAMGGKTDWPDADAYKTVFYEKLIPATYNHRPSMLQDLENKKPTEIDSLAGYISQKGKSFSVETPTCDMLMALVKFKESNFNR